jgi:hypothetical protein
MHTGKYMICRICSACGRNPPPSTICDAKQDRGVAFVVFVPFRQRAPAGEVAPAQLFRRPLERLSAQAPDPRDVRCV